MKTRYRLKCTTRSGTIIIKDRLVRSEVAQRVGIYKARYESCLIKVMRIKTEDVTKDYV